MIYWFESQRKTDSVDFRLQKPKEQDELQCGAIKRRSSLFYMQ